MKPLPNKERITMYVIPKVHLCFTFEIKYGRTLSIRWNRNLQYQTEWPSTKVEILWFYPKYWNVHMTENKLSHKGQNWAFNDFWSQLFNPISFIFWETFFSGLTILHFPDTPFSWKFYDLSITITFLGNKLLRLLFHNSYLVLRHNVNASGDLINYPVLTSQFVCHK